MVSNIVVMVFISDQHFELNLELTIRIRYMISVKFEGRAQVQQARMSCDSRVGLVNASGNLFIQCDALPDTPPIIVTCILN